MNKSKSHIIEVLQNHNGFLPFPPDADLESVHRLFNISIEDLRVNLEEMAKDKIVFRDKHGVRLMHWPFGKVYRQIRKKRR